MQLTQGMTALVTGGVSGLGEASALALVGAREQGVRVALRFSRDVGSVIVDKIQVQQVALNLIRNAIDAMEGQPRRELAISVAADENEKGFVLVSVADTGTGVPAGALRGRPRGLRMGFGSSIPPPRTPARREKRG